MELSLFQILKNWQDKKKNPQCLCQYPSMYMYSLYFQKFFWEGYYSAFHYSGSNYFSLGAFKPFFLLYASGSEASRPSVLQNHWILLSDKTDLLVKKEISILPKHQDSLPSKYRLLLCPSLWQLSRNICLLYITSPKKIK